jgi:Dolichyl-phosphate-mannose-protein mannosyltransferase
MVISVLEKQALPQGTPLFCLPYHFRDRSLRSVIVPVVVFAAAIALAVLLFSRFLANSRQLWTDPIHDRHAHLYSGLCVATDVRHGRWLQLALDLEKLRIWPPLHDGFLLGIALLLGQGDERWAVLPSLIAWIGTALLAFLLARRSMGRGGTIAGLVAAILCLVSPALRAFATDVMLESVGACLTMLCLYLYMRLLQDGGIRNACCLGIALTALFLEKYNYWLVTVVALGLHQVATGPYLSKVWEHRTRWQWLLLRNWTRQQLRHPLSYVLVILVAACAMVARMGGADFELFGKHVNIRSNAGLALAAYVVLLLRLWPWYRQSGRHWLRRADARARGLVYCHVLPLLVWFLLPQRLATFLWYTNPGTNVGEFPRWDILGGYRYYWGCLTQDYHVGAWSAVGVVCLLLIAAWTVARRQLRPGGAAILCIIVVGFLLCAHHPNRKSRFLHSWIPLAWVGAGMGAGALWRLSRSSPLMVRTGVALPLIGFGALHGLGLVAPAHAPEGGVHAECLSVLEVTDSYLPYLADSEHAAVLSNMPLKFLAQWTYTKEFGRAEHLVTEIPGFDAHAADNHVCFEKWLATTPCDTVVHLDIPRGTPFYAAVPGCEGLALYGELLAGQASFEPIFRRNFSGSGCIVTVWRRRGSVGLIAQRH